MKFVSYKLVLHIHSNKHIHKQASTHTLKQTNKHTLVYACGLSFEGGKEGGLQAAIASLNTQVAAAVKAGCQVSV
jgi:hypothetical protein